MKNKVAFLIAAIYLSASAVTSEYADVVAKIEKHYMAEQVRFAKTEKGQYVYGFSPIVLFPFFMVPDSLLPRCIEFYKPDYSCGFSTYANRYVDDLLVQRLEISTVQYVRLNKNTPPWVKTYTLFSFRKRFLRTSWVEDRKPIVVNLRWDNINNQYRCR
jgi:hypothetical protein